MAHRDLELACREFMGWSDFLFFSSGTTHMGHFYGYWGLVYIAPMYQMGQ
jgi:hypothetical protein